MSNFACPSFDPKLDEQPRATAALVQLVQLFLRKNLFYKEHALHSHVVLLRAVSGMGSACPRKSWTYWTRPATAAFQRLKSWTYVQKKLDMRRCVCKLGARGHEATTRLVVITLL